MTFYTVTINNRKYDYLNFKFKRQVGINAQVFEGYFQIAGSVLPQQGQTIKVEKNILGNKILKFQGKVSGVGYLPSESGQVYVSAYDLNRKSSYLQSASLGFSSPTKSSTEFTTQIAPTSATDLTQGTVDTTDTAPDTVNFGKSITGGDSRLHRNQVLEILQMISDRDIYITKAGAANFLFPAGTDRSSSMVLIDGLNGNLLGPEGYFEDDTRIVKKVIVKGKGAGIKDAFIGSATDPGYTTDDKLRQFELPYLTSTSTCNTVANNILQELKKRIKYAKFEMSPDPFTIDYDIFDTVKLKAKFQQISKTINENLKIFSVFTDVSIDKQESEIVILELADFRRGIWAPLILPSKAGEANQGNIALSSISTQAQDHVGASGGASVIVEQGTSGASGIITSVESTLATFTALGATKLAGTFLNLDFKIIVQKFGAGVGIMEVRIGDGTDHYPAGANRLFIQYRPFVGQLTYRTASIFIPIDLNGKTLTVKCRTTDGEVVAVMYAYLETIGEHKH